MDTLTSSLAIFVSVLSAFGFAKYLESYFGEKGKNLATTEDMDKLVTQMKALTEASETIKKDLTIKIEDTGTGMTDIPKMFKVGDQTNKHSILNEHGFGLKHALAAANPQNDNWSVSTRTKSDFSKREFSLIHSPYRFENLEVEKLRTDILNLFD